jgi:hypothetical protein
MIPTFPADAVGGVSGHSLELTNWRLGSEYAKSCYHFARTTLYFMNESNKKFGEILEERDFHL